MLSNEVRPGRNLREMHRISQSQICHLSRREKTSKSFESTMSGNEWKESRINNNSRVNSRRDSPAYDQGDYYCSAKDKDRFIDDVSLLESNEKSVNDIRETRKNLDLKNENNDSTCECEKNKKEKRVNRLTSFTDRKCTRNLYKNYTNNCLDEWKNGHGDNVRWTRCKMRNIFLDNRSWQALVSLIFIVLVSVSGVKGEQRKKCAIGIDTPGVTWPQGDIVLEFGEPLRILCMLSMEYTNTKFPGKNSSDLVFFHNKKEMEPEFTTIINETTIAMYVERPPPAEDMYYCKLRLNETEDVAVCLNKVAIGHKPEEPKNFSCVSHNWENVICTWEPVQNYVTTKFDLVFKLPGRAGGRKLYPCPKEPQKNLAPNTCLWDTSTNPIYRQPYEYYTFILNVTNFLGVASFTYKFHHFAHVIPAKPANLSVVNKTLDSALLHWNVPFPMQNFPPGLHHRISYQHQWDHRKTWRVINITSETHMEKRYFNLTGLEHANTKYDVRAFIKSALATGEDKWSQFSDVTFRTPPRVPGLPPRTDIGSFEIAENNANRDVYLYWQSIPAHMENGDNFKYQIARVEENGRKLSLLPNETTRTYAKFKGISFNSFRFEIVTTNILGANKEKAKIYVPSRLEMPPEPLAFTKIAFDEGLYELSWKPPLMNNDITNYTIFWCDNERDRPWQCTGYLDWIHVSRNTSIYNVTVPDANKVYQFAISANTRKASSGMIWASCTVIHNKVVGKMKSVWINRIGSDFIEVGWKLECSDRIGVVEGFNIYYCPIVSPYNLNCREPKMNMTIRANHAPIHGIVHGLKPYTTYMLAVSVLTKNGEGLHTDPLYNTTLEAAPSTPPLNVSITDITNSSMLVTWNTPSAMNGVLRYYEIHYNSVSQKVDEAQHVALKDLMPHKNYSIRVAACTVSCSVTSPPIFGLTAIGKPGKISDAPNVRFMNSSQVLVRWSEPSNPGGYLDYYQIWSADGEIRNSTKTDALLPITDCKTAGRERMYQFRVRAVNIALDGTHLEGPWSDTGEGNCYSDGPSFRVWVVIWIITGLSALAFLLCVAYTSKRMWLKCKAMQDVEVKLPPGLAPNMKLLQKVGEQHMRQSSADSSGCSSGHESVTSSLTTESHVSNDSGADVDPPANPPTNKLLETAPSWEASSLRQRNVGTTRPVGMNNESPRWDSYVKVSKAGEPVLDDTLSMARSTPNLTDSTGGYGASPHAWSSTGYISMPSSEELSSNPSPVPKETSNQPVAGGYCVVGVAPKPILRTKVDERTADISNNLMGKNVESKANIPYVTLASLDEKMKNKTKPLDMIRCDLDDLEDLAFIEPDTLEPIPILDDNASKPYVQTGLLDTMKKPQPFVALTNFEAPKQSLVDASLTDSLTNKPFATSFANARTMKPNSMETMTTAKPYVAVGWMPEIAAASASGSSSRTLENPTQKSHCSAAGSTEATSAKPPEESDQAKETSSQNVQDAEKNKPTGSYSLWQKESTGQAKKEETVPTLDCDEKPTNKTSQSYVTIGEKPRLESQQTSTSSGPYVQHQRFEKQLPQEQKSVPKSTTTDERYSKISVAPNTIQ